MKNTQIAKVSFCSFSGRYECLLGEKVHLIRPIKQKREKEQASGHFLFGLHFLANVFQFSCWSWQMVTNSPSEMTITVVVMTVLGSLTGHLKIVPLVHWQSLQQFGGRTSSRGQPVAIRRRRRLACVCRVGSQFERTALWLCHCGTTNSVPDSFRCVALFVFIAKWLSTVTRHSVERYTQWQTKNWLVQQTLYKK